MGKRFFSIMGMLSQRKYHALRNLKKNVENGSRIKENLKIRKINYILNLISKNK